MGSRVHSSSKAERLRKANAPKRPPGASDRLPPGQVWTDRFPILHEGEVPVYDLATWTLHLFGELEAERVLRYADVMALPQSEVVCDIHCVTRWSKADTRWEGVLFRDLLQTVRLKPGVRHVMVYGDHDYTANIPLDDLMRPNVILAHRYDGQPLTVKHGWPLRLVVPHLYFWKSVKWVRGFEFLTEGRLGYWEQRGFHAYGDPFAEQRFSGEDLEIPEDEWTKKEYD
ncbi:MAG: sulfite oxidase-like oxidoreductase [Alicyclobacillaceae bacterium]|nr:sulfite oxidase-like oxidoreductase [Alicyclobacillaceae bacterium]